ncbi:MAG: PAS domain S-box protein [Myxococcales bacterium]
MNRDGPVSADVRFDRLVEQSADGILVVDADGRVCLANAAAAELLSRPRGNLVGLPFGYPAVGSEPVEISIVTGARDPSVVELRAAEIEWQGGPAHLINLRDVSERKQRERTLARLARVRHAMVEVGGALVTHREPTAALQSSCQALVRAGAYDAVAIALGADAGDVVLRAESVAEDADPAVRPPDPLTLWSQHGKGAEQAAGVWVESADAEAAGGAGRGCIVAEITADGRGLGAIALVLPPGIGRKLEELELSGRLAVDLGYALGLARREADRRAAEARHLESEARFGRLFENSIDAIVIADGRGRFVDVNAAACEMFGIGRERLLQMSVGELAVPEGAPEPGERYRQYVEAGSEKGSFRFVASDGRTHVAEYSAFPLSEDRFVSMLRDVTARVEMEQQLRDAQRMEALGRLAGGVAHDFNNLLTAIVSFTQLARDATDEAQRNADLDEVLRAAERAGDLTERLLIFSRRKAVEPSPVDLNALVRGMQRLFSRTLGAQIELIVRLAEPLPRVRIDAGQLEPVILNLVVNARDAMPRGGTLRLETAAEPGAAGELWCVLRVTDTGEGMDDAVRARMFDPFFTTKEPGKGTGLGLSMAHSVVSEAGGEIRIDSAPGRGTSIELRFRA